jgi:hypothetical protein
MSSHAAPAAEMLAPPVPTPVERVAAPDAAVTVPRGAAALNWIAPVRGWQTVAWEAAALAAAAGYGHSATTEGIAYAGAGALVGMTSVRFRGRHLVQWADTQGRYRYRRVSTRRGTNEPATAAEPLASLLPGLGLGEYVDRAGNRVGLAATDGGWVSAVRLRSSGEPQINALIEVLREAYAATTIPLASAQLVVWTAAPPEAPQPQLYLASPDLSETMSLRAMPSPDVTDTANLATTHPPLPQPSPDLSETVTMQAITGLAGPGRPAQGRPSPEPQNLAPMRVTWLALRYRPRQAPYAAAARGGGELGSARTVASAALGLVARLDEAGFTADALNQSELGQELMVAVHGADPSPPNVQESWRDWSAGSLRQICYEPHRALDPAALLGRWTPGAAFTCASYTLSRTARGRIRGEAALRIAGVDAEALMPPFPAIRANGRQQEFVLRTMPLAVHT